MENYQLYTMADSKGKVRNKYKSIVTELGENKKYSFLAKMMAKFMFSVARIIELNKTETKALIYRPTFLTIAVIMSYLSQVID